MNRHWFFFFFFFFIHCVFPQIQIILLKTLNVNLSPEVVIVILQFTRIMQNKLYYMGWDEIWECLVWLSLMQIYFELSTNKNLSGFFRRSVDLYILVFWKTDTFLAFRLCERFPKTILKQKKKKKKKKKNNIKTQHPFLVDFKKTK